MTTLIGKVVKDVGQVLSDTLKKDVPKVNQAPKGGKK